MATLTHAQYNSPMPIYSKDNVDAVVQQTQDFMQHRQHSPSSGQFDPSQSGAYRLLQENGQLAPSHSARLDEQVDEYPKYRGFVDPRVQSPSFKRLQYVTGMDSGTEDESTNELHAPVKARTDDIRSSSESRQTAVSQQAQSTAPTVQQTPAKVQEYKPQWAENASGPRVAQRDPISDNVEQEEPIDAVLLARLAEAERPKVPPPIVPNWTQKAQEKHQKWQQYGEKFQHRPYEYQAPRANWQSDAGRVRGKWGTYIEGTTRTKSAEPAARPTTQLTPYVAPSVASTKFAPPAQPSYSPLSTYSRPSTKLDYAPRPYSSLSTASSSYQRESSAPYHPPRPVPATTPSQRKPVNVATLVSGEALQPGTHPPAVPPWSKHAEYKRTVWESKRNAVDPEYQRRRAGGEPTPPWARKAEQTHSLWQQEADAWRRRQTGGGERPRATSAGPESTMAPTWRPEATTAPSWRQRPVPHETVSAPMALPWKGTTTGTASNAQTKTQSAGNYLDRDGNRVSYTKEVYTSSDPGKEFSSLTEEEKKILEEPMQPGVLSRHVTKKYYKKSTYTSSTTTSTNQTPPVTTSITRTYEYTPPNPNPRLVQSGVSEY